MLGLSVLAAQDEAFVQPLQAPDVPQMPAWTRQRLIEPKIGAVNRLGFVAPSRFHQARQGRDARVASIPNARRKAGCRQSRHAGADGPGPSRRARH